MAKPRAKPPPPTVSEEELTRRHARWLFFVGTLANLLKWIVAGGTVWAVSYTGIYLPVQASAGQETNVTVLQRWIVEADVQVYLAWGSAGAGCLYGFNERRKRLRERETKDRMISDLQKKVDPERTSSELDVEGEKERGKT